MKKFILSLLVILVLTSIFSISFAKTFSDVKGTKYEASVGVLTDLGIVSGYQDGTFKPNNTVTRAELAKLIIFSLGKEKTADALKGKTDFTDVVANSWASGYINCASSLGIIKGYPDGSFKPSNSVSYVEASTMLLRALNYTKELEKEKYPTGYMKKANDAGILNNVTANSSSDAAIRGNIANMVLNTLMGNTRKIVSTSSNGTVTYGDSTPLIEQTFKGYYSVRGGKVYDIDFNDRELTIKDDTQNRKVYVYADETMSIEELYGREVDFLYDKEADIFIVFNIIDDYKLVEVDVKEIEKETVYDAKDNEYDIPEDVILQYIYNYDEAETAYILYDGKKIKSMVLSGTPKVYAGIVSETGIKVDGRKGFEIQKPSGKYEEFAFSDTTDKVSQDNVILYSLDNDDYAVIHNEFSLKKSINIEELTSTSIKLKKESKISLTSDVEFYVYLVDSELNIREGKLKDIEEEFDKADTYKYADVWYIVVFEDTVDDDEIVSKLSVSEAKELLKDAITAANKILKKESSYSVATFEALKEATAAGTAALNTSSSAAKMELCARKINDCKDNMKSATSADKQLRNDFANLQAIIKEGEAKKAADYTSASYKALQDALKTAKAIKLANTTSAKISDQITAVRKAINMLVTNTANEEIQGAINNLKELIARGDAIVKSHSNDYTTETYSEFTTALNTAKKFNTSSASLSEIKTQASNLEAAIDNLEPKLLATYKTTRATLDSTYQDANGRKASNYTEESFEQFEELFADLKIQYRDLLKLDEVEVLSNSEIQNEITTVNNLNTAIKNALKVLVTVTDDTTRSNLKKLIAKAEAVTESDWEFVSPTYSEFKSKVSEYKTLANNPSSTETEFSNAISYLVRYVSF